MPTYDYECDACGHREEVFQAITAEVLKKCPKCKKNKYRRLFGAGAAIMFKGSGFYQTDYRSDSYKKAADAEKTSSSSSSSETKSETKSESAPAPKAEAKSDSKPSKGKKE